MRTISGYVLDGDYVFHHPCSVMVAGSSGSGKVSSINLMISRI